jgi:hypothetical protein
MHKAWIRWGGAAATLALALVLAAPVKAVDQSGVRPVAEELDKRTKAPEAKGGGLSDSAVRVMSTFAWSLLPDEYPDTQGKKVKIDKSDPNKFFIPTDDARRIIRVATRSAYAEVCDLRDLEKSNYQTLMKGEEARKVWSREQMMFINALHMFSVSYFTGSAKITESDEPNTPPKIPGTSVTPAPAETAAGAQTTNTSTPTEPAAPAESAAQIIIPKKLDCPPEQKERVRQSIAAYVQAAKASPPQAAQGAEAPKTAPVAGGSN